MLHHDGGGVAHLKRDLPGVLDHLHPVGTERMRRVGDELGVAFAILPGARASSNMRARSHARCVRFVGFLAIIGDLSRCYFFQFDGGAHLL